MRRVSVFFIALGVFMLPTAAFAVEDEAPEPVHIALGDSVAFGVGTPNEAQLSYSAVLSRWARSVDCQEGGSRACPGLELVNLVVPGATSSTLITDRLPTALEMISERNRDASPHNDVVLVTLTIGGNDLYTPVISQCAGGVTPTCVETIQGVFQSLQPEPGGDIGLAPGHRRR
ncbi:MAG TPA: SGNH/GDSL hydrolase family protein [Acidimicrobiia bacterium]|nr:SGNH/GDSL hydrolase family protein [Acidimicrobiia bacterium]